MQTDADWAANLSDTVAALPERVPTYAFEVSVSGTPYFKEFEGPSWEMDACHMVDVAFLFDTTIFNDRSSQETLRAKRKPRSSMRRVGMVRRRTPARQDQCSSNQPPPLITR